MTDAVYVKNYKAPPVCRREILRYAGGGKTEEGEVSRLLDSCLEELAGKLSYRVCWRVFPVGRRDGVLDLSFAETASRGLFKNLAGCGSAVLFAATVGLEVDRLIARYGRISPARALLFEAIGTERIESLCDVFSEDMRRQAQAAGGDTRPRFSPGYGDLPLALQRDIFHALDCARKIGLTLNDSLMMSPAKSVTAIIGITDRAGENKRKDCTDCGKQDCVFRKN